LARGLGIVHTAYMSEIRARASALNTGLLARAEMVAETTGINLYSERSLHAQIKRHYWSRGDRFEVAVDGKVVDLLKADGEIVEVQTRGLSKIEDKVLGLAASGRKVRVVHPVAVESEIRRLDPKTDELLSSRRSPKRGSFYELFGELVRASGLVAARNVTIEVLLVKTAETRKNDGSGSWRRKGDRTLDRELVAVLGSRALRTPSQWLSVIPKDLEAPWSSAALGKALGLTAERGRHILYCLSRAGLIVETGRQGRLKLYGPRPSRSQKRNS